MSCSGVRADAIGDSTVGCWASQASETAATVVSCAAATSSSAAMTSRDRSSHSSVHANPPRLVSASTPGRYLPVRNPRASEKNGMHARPSRRHSSSSSPS